MNKELNFEEEIKNGLSLCAWGVPLYYSLEAYFAYMNKYGSLKNGKN